MDFEAVLASVGEFLNGLGPTIVLPVIIIVLGLILRMKFGAAVRSGLVVAVGFVGIFLTVGLLGSTVTEIGQAFAKNTGTGLSIIDIGWPAASSLAFGSPIGYLIIPLGIVLNVILLLVRATKTLDVDLWNFWHIAFVGALVQFVTGNFWIALFAAVIAFVIALFLADWSAPLVQKYFGLPGISIPHLQSAGYMMLAVPFAWVLRKIPGLRNMKINPDTTRRRLGLLGEPMVLGFVIGLVLALVAGQDVAKALGTAITLAAVMLLIPRMVSILMEGLTPLAVAARTFMNDRFKGREVYIGLDAAVLVGSPAVIAAGLLMVPVEILLSLALSPLGNQTLPFVDLADGVFVAALLAPLVGGDLLLTVILGAIVMGIGLWFCTQIAPAVSAMVASSTTIDIPEGYDLFTVMSDGSVPISYGFFYLAQTPVVVMIIVALAFVVGLYFLKTRFPLGERLLPVVLAGEATAGAPATPAASDAAPAKRSAGKAARGGSSSDSTES
jgi:PTS system galactitol-specific IIC component